MAVRGVERSEDDALMHRYSAFVIRLLTDESNTLLEGQVEQVGSQETVHIRDVQEALAFVASRLEGAAEAGQASKGGSSRGRKRPQPSAAPPAYADNLAHLLAELSLLDLRLLRQVQRMRRRDGSRLEDELRGLLVSDEQIDSILASLPVGGPPEQDGPDAVLEAIARRAAEVAAARWETLRAGVPLRLERLRTLYGLDDFEAFTVVLCLAPELDSKYESLYAYVQDDVGKKRPTINLALTLFSNGLSERVELRRAFSASSPLVKNGLLQVTEESPNRESSVTRFLRLEARVADYLLGADDLDARLLGLARLAAPAVSLDDVVLQPDVHARARRVAERLQGPNAMTDGAVVQLVGPAGTGKKALAQALCRALGKQLLVADCGALVASDLPEEVLVTAVLREALLQDAVVCWDRAHLLLEDGARERALQGLVLRALADHAGVSILAGERAWRPHERSTGRPFFTLEMSQPEYAERLRLWRSGLAGLPRDVTDEDLTVLASKFRLSGGQVRQAAMTARDFALLRTDADGENALVSADDLGAASRWHSNQRLALLAQKIEPRYGWEDIILPADQKAQLTEICGQFRHTATVFGEWGFLRKTSRGKGMSVLFAGPSGTGKTMAAEIIAGELGLDLYRIDLSSVVSKYVGETEKNLDRIFREAEDSNAILFFDEADALFGKRSEVKDAHDRYANIEVSYLLQKMEDYQGIVILATNFRKNMDEAFVRRLSFAVDFPFPDEQHRLQIWRRAFPEDAPLQATEEFPFLARQLKVAGGNIKNIALTSAFLAAQEAAPIGIQHIVWAAKREYQKMGKLIQEADFGPYFDMVKG
jgi:SpoVK/Ycf46/Vps4 family AAA+-type ATPase